MPESNLAATWDEIRRRIAKKRGYNPDVTAWTPEQIVDVNDIIRSGYRVFLKQHSWTFLKPVFDLILPSGQEDVDLPADFGFLVGDLHFVDDTVANKRKLVRLNDGQVLTMRHQAMPATGQPQYCAIVPGEGPGVTHGQRQRLLLWPTPTQDWTVRGRYSLLASAISISNPHPYGGAAHSETLIQACLAASEEFNDTPGSATAHFKELVASSIEYDRKVGAQMIDNEDSRYHRDRDGRFRGPQTLPTTYNGQYSA